MKTRPMVNSITSYKDHEGRKPTKCARDSGANKNSLEHLENSQEKLKVRDREDRLRLLFNTGILW